MRVVLDGAVLEGHAVDLPVDAPPPPTILRAVQGATAPAVRIECPPPGPAHDLLWNPASPPTSVRGLLAAAARTHGHVAPERDDLDAVRAELETASVPETDTATGRRAVAAAGQEVEQLRERVATVRGRLQARREVGSPTRDVEADLAAAVARLSEAETERIAAEQEFAAAERQARMARTRRQRLLRLQDRADNLARAARRSLAATVHDEFADALDAVPGSGEAGDRPGAYEGDPVTAALAACRIASLDAPVLDETGRFADAAAAADCLDVPVLRR